MRQTEANIFLDKLNLVHPDWVTRWCFKPNVDFPSPCACMGCVDVSGRAGEVGITYRQWNLWLIDRREKNEIRG